MKAAPPPRKLSPHIRRFLGVVIDYNGVGPWSSEGIRSRYIKFRDVLNLPKDQLATDRTSHKGRIWTYPLMGEVIRRIETGDRAAIEIGIELIEEDDFFFFGKMLKSNTARALRRADLTEAQKSRITQRIVAMMLAGNVPHEFREYKKLLRTIGVKDLWPVLEDGIDRDNKYVMRHYHYLRQQAAAGTPILVKPPNPKNNF